MARPLHARLLLPCLLIAALALVAAGAAQAMTRSVTAAASTGGLVAAYSFDEGTGTSVADASGNGNNGTITGATWTTGKFGSALSFNGSSAYVSVPDSASLDLSSQLTLEAWVKPTTLSGWTAIVNKEQPGNITYGLFANSDTNQPAGIIYPSGATGESITRGTSQLATGAWTFLTATYDGSTLSLYANGTLVSSLAVSASIATSNSPLRIGANTIWGEYFNGLIDNVRIYSTALTATQIQSDMNTPIGGTGGTGLVAAYAFDEGSGTTTADASGNGNAGTLSGATWTTGKNGNALSFNGTSSYVTVGDAPDLELSQQMTLEAWVKPTALSGWTAIVNKEQPGNITYGLFANSDTNQPAGIIYPTGATGESITRGTSQLATGTWTHLAATYDGSTLKLYVNGALASSLAVPGAILTSTSPLRIGANTIWGEYFNGAIDDVRVYDRALSQTEIQTDMNTPVGKVTGSTAPANTALPAVSGTAEEGATLSATSGTWTNSPTSYAYQWKRCDSTGASCSSISGATAQTYTLASADVGSTIRACVTATNAGGSSSATSGQTPVVNNGLVAAYAFDEGSGTTTADASGHGNAGTISGATWTTGKNGNALSFNGSNAWVTVNDSPSLDLTNGMTLEAWVKPSSLSGWRAIAVKEQTGDLVYSLYANSDTNTPANVVYDGGAEHILYGAGQVATGTWTHLAATYDGSTLRLYANGTQVASTPLSGPITTSTGALRIGGDSIWGEYFNGVIDDLRIYNRALPQAEIQADMNTPVGGSGSPPPPPPPGDTTPPSTPAGLSTSGITQSAVTLNWAASTDNVGVAGYGVYENGTSVGSTTTTSYTFTGLACGTSYTLGVDAYDAAGNRSARATTTAATSACSGGGGGGGGTPSVYLSPSGSDSNPCTAAAPCASLNRGYQAAPATGGIVQLAGGYYGCNAISGSKSGTVIFQAASGQVPWITCELSLDTNHLEFDNLNIEGIRTTSANYITLRNTNITCLDQAPFELWGGKCSAGLFLFAPAGNFSMYGGSVGPTWDDTYDGAPGQSQIGINLSGGSATSNNLLFDGVRFHDNRRIDNTQHTSCLMVGGGNGVTIRNSRFENCAVFDVFFTWWNFVSPQYPPGTNILLENNFFDTAVAGCSGCTAGYYTVEFANYQPVWQNVTIRYNSASQEMHFDGSHSNFVVDSNAMPMLSYDCPGDITYRYNVSTGGTCGGTGSKQVSDLAFVNPAAGDLHLLTSSPAINAGNPSSYPSTDIDGQARPMGSAPDAGADEAG